MLRVDEVTFKEVISYLCLVLFFYIWNWNFIFFFVELSKNLLDSKGRMNVNSNYFSLIS